MSHRVTLDIPDDVYRLLAEKARQTGQPEELVAAALLVRAVAGNGPSAELRRTAGFIDADVPDLCKRLDDYLGQPLADELKDRPNG